MSLCFLSTDCTLAGDRSESDPYSGCIRKLELLGSVRLKNPAHGKVAPHMRAATEWEPDLTPEVRAALTTTDGTVAGLVPGHPMPDWLDEWWQSPAAAELRAGHPDLKTAGTLPWPELPAALQDRLIGYSIFRHAEAPDGARMPVDAAFVYFTSDRSFGIHELGLRNRVPVNLSRNWNVLGQTLTPGKTELALATVNPREKVFTTRRNKFNSPSGGTYLNGEFVPEGLQILESKGFVSKNPVEFIEQSDLMDVTLGRPLVRVETHLRSSKGTYSGGDVALANMALADGLGFTESPIHVHLIVSSPLKTMAPKKDPEGVMAAGMVDFITGAVLLEQSRSLLNGYSISDIKADIHTPERSFRTFIFGTLRSENVTKMTRQFYNWARDPEHPPEIGTDFKESEIVPHFQDKYDEKGVWGIQVRTIDGADGPESGQAVLNALHSKMADNRFAVTKPRLENWLGRPLKGLTQEQIGELVASKMEESWWNRDWDKVFVSEPEELRAILDPASRMRLLDLNREREQLSTIVEKGFEVKMLLHDWSTTFLFFDKPEALTKIRAAQVEALTTLNALTPDQAEAQLNKIMAKFLIRSGIWEEITSAYDLVPAHTTIR